MAANGDTATARAAQCICKRCNSAFPRRRGKNEFCRDCAKARLPEVWKRSREKRRSAIMIKKIASGTIPLGSRVSCERCGQDYIRSNGMRRYCTDCRIIISHESAKTRQRRYMQRHGPSRNERRRKSRWRLQDQEVAYRKSEHRKQRLRQWWRERMLIPRHALSKRISHAIRLALGKRKAGRRWETIVGYSLDDLMRHIERQFERGMTWENMGEWHIDHVLPIAMFSYETCDDPEFRACWALTNLRPLWAKKNLQKADSRALLI